MYFYQLRQGARLKRQEQELDWIQMLRGIAALLVVLTHARYALLNTEQWGLANQIFIPGAMGVDLFFVISGFIMYYSTVGTPTGPAAAANFLIKRFARVWPVYAVVSLAYVLVVNGGWHYFDGNKANFLRSIFFLPVDPRQPPYFTIALQVGWTLVFEMYFYLVFAGSMLFHRLRWFVMLSWIVLTVFLLPLGRVGLNLEVTKDLGYHSRYMAIVTSPFILEFLAGVAIGWAYRAPWLRFSSKPVAAQLMWVGCGFGVWAIYSGATYMHGPTHWGWPVALMVLSLAIGVKTLPFKVPRLLLWLGAISYSLYLTHLIAQHVVKVALTKVGLEPFTHGWNYMFISTVLSLPLAALSHHYLELGVAPWLRKRMLQAHARLLQALPRRGLRAAPTAAAPAPESTAGAQEGQRRYGN